MRDSFYIWDATELGDEIAAEMRDYYEANRPLTFWEKIFGKRIYDSIVADDLMIGLMQVVRECDDIIARQRAEDSQKR
jgi:hypothetical protein